MSDPRLPRLIVGKILWCDTCEKYVDGGVIRFGNEEIFSDVCRPCFDQAAKCREEGK